ncbi:AAA family ATPase [Polyangium sp. 6x1]|uniref:AAA family ATPase n=1 Tax=Polyangium sp. 6x1 TaxID=3042689 RepID=UPI002482B0EB|nr:AAA family ATPase [Polyangium sp. 6x1]MDI1443658.1 AAA family ATPase [Polyangium sp. 6x1]
MSTERSASDIARDALMQLLQAETPSQVFIDGRKVTVSSEKAVGHQRMVQCDWGTGRTTLQISLRVGSQVALNVNAGRGQAIYSNFNAFVEGAIANEQPARLIAYNTIRSKGGDDGKAREYSKRSIWFAARSGLPNTSSVDLGTFDIRKQTWTPEPKETLKRIVCLAVIKAHFLDRGSGERIHDAPLFAIDGDNSPISDDEYPEATPRPEGKLSGLNNVPGGPTKLLDTLREWTETVVDAQPSENQFVAFVSKMYGVGVTRAGQMLRHCKNLDLFDVRDGVLVATDFGTQFIAGPDPLRIYRQLAARYTGFEETLAFFAQNPGARVGALRKHLNQALGTKWDTDAQPQTRAYWLTGLGFLHNDNGHYMVTDVARAHLPEASSSKDAPSVDTDVDGGDDAIETASFRDITHIRLDPAAVKLGDLVLPDGLVERCCAALNAGKHLLLVGPPGTAKSTLAERIAMHASEVHSLYEPLTATASADWTTYDTIGGWAQRREGGLRFREGVVTRALHEGRWLVLDELNRADVDKCFGELFTVLAGGTVTTAYTREVDGRDEPIEIGFDATHYHFGPWFRLIATMNVRDKASLFRLSYAFLRRFAVITVPALEDDFLQKLCETEGAKRCADAEKRALALRVFSKKNGLGRFVDLGPSMLLDVLSYAHARIASAPRAVGEGLEMLVFPQFEGLGDADARDADRLIGSLFSEEPTFARSLQRSFRSNFSHVRWPDD